VAWSHLRGLYAAGVLTLWLALMGYQAYDGYLRTSAVSPDVAELTEPWDATYLVRWQGHPCGFLAERLYLNASSTGWTREESFFLSETAFGTGLLGTALLGVRSGGGLDSLLLRFHSLSGSVLVEAQREGEVIRVNAHRDGQALLESVEIPMPVSAKVRLDLPLFGVERLADGAHEFSLPTAPGLDLHRLKVAVQPGGPNAPKPGSRIRSIRVEAEDGTWVTLDLDQAGHLEKALASVGLSLEATNRKVIGQFVLERESLMERIGKRSAGAKESAKR
jgi:hypothetical protein